MAPTLDDVARIAGVSSATVSRCLNQPDRVNEKTRTNVMNAVRDLEYSPNFAARVMAAKRSNTIGAIIPTMENAIFARGLQAFQEELRDRGYTLLVASSSYRADVEEEQIRKLVSRGADAVLLIGYDRDPAIYRFLEAQSVPYLVAWAQDRRFEIPAVGFDNRTSMRALAAWAIRLGHRRIGVISAVMKDNDRARFRVEGVRDACLDGGVPLENLRVLETTYGIDRGADAFRELLTSGLAPTVVLCGNDVLAVGAMGQAREMGLDIPGDVSITGFDDIELARIVVPALTTVHVPHREMGRKAARTLIDMVERGTPGSSIELAAEIRARGTLAPVAGRA